MSFKLYHKYDIGCKGEKRKCFYMILSDFKRGNLHIQMPARNVFFDLFEPIKGVCYLMVAYGEPASNSIEICIRFFQTVSSFNTSSFLSICLYFFY